jgi:hypothetical protein
MAPVEADSICRDLLALSQSPHNHRADIPSKGKIVYST